MTMCVQDWCRQWLLVLCLITESVLASDNTNEKLPVGVLVMIAFTGVLIVTTSFAFCTLLWNAPPPIEPHDMSPKTLWRELWLTNKFGLRGRGLRTVPPPPHDPKDGSMRTELIKRNVSKKTDDK